MDRSEASPRTVIDGEMPAAALQERLATIVASAPDVELDPEKIRILAGDLIEAGGIGNLASTEVQAEIDPLVDGVDLLVLDNLSSLTAVIRDKTLELGSDSRMATEIAPARDFRADRPSRRQRGPAARNKPARGRARH